LVSVTYDKAQRIFPGAEKPAVDNLELDIHDGEFMVLVCPLGVRQVRLTAHARRPGAGDVGVNPDRRPDITMVPPEDRDIAMVFQNYALYPHTTVAENMAFALKMAGVSKEDRRTRVEEAARLLDLVDFLDRKPKALSGGQRQRVAMGRAIVRRPQVFS
jgi:multiple sugar transport system ATP-binding protein